MDDGAVIPQAPKDAPGVTHAVGERAAQSTLSSEKTSTVAALTKAEREQLMVQKALEDQIRRILGLQTNVQEKELQIWQTRLKDAEALKSVSDKFKGVAGLAGAILEQKQKKNEIAAQFYTSGLKGKAGSILQKAGMGAIEGVAGKVSGAVGFDVAGYAAKMLGLSPAMLGPLGVASTLYSWIKMGVQELAQGLPILASAGGAAGDAVGGLAEAMEVMRHASRGGWIDAVDHTALLKNMAVATAEGAVATGIYSEKQDGAIGRISEASEAVGELMRTSNALGMTGDQATKAMFTLNRQFGGSVTAIPKMFSAIAGLTTIFRTSPQAFMQSTLAIADSTKYLDVSFEKAIRWQTAYAASVSNMVKGAPSGSFWEKAGKFPQEITAAMFKASAAVSAEQFLAFSGKPLGDFFGAYGGAMLATPMDKMVAALKFAAPIARQVGGPTAQGQAAALSTLIPSFKALPADLAMHVSEAFLKNPDIFNGNSNDQLKAIESVASKQGHTLTESARASFAMSDPLERIFSALVNFLQSFLKFGNIAIRLMGKSPEEGSKFEKDFSAASGFSARATTGSSTDGARRLALGR